METTPAGDKKIVEIKRVDITKYDNGYAIRIEFIDDGSPYSGYRSLIARDWPEAKKLVFEFLEQV